MFWLGLLGASIGLVLMLTKNRVVEMVQFHAKARPEMVMMNVARAGPDRSKFDDFVAAAKNAIIVCQQRARATNVGKDVKSLGGDNKIQP